MHIINTETLEKAREYVETQNIQAGIYLRIAGEKLLFVEGDRTGEYQVIIESDSLGVWSPL